MNNLHPLRHPHNTQLPTKLAPLATRPLPHRLGKINPVPLPVGLLHGLHVQRIPVEADEARDEQLASEAVLSGRREGVVEEEGVSDGFVDDAVENVGQELALEERKGLEIERKEREREMKSVSGTIFFFPRHK